MAKTGQLVTNAYDERYYELVWEITGQDNNANQSTIKWTVYARGGSGWYAERTLKVVIADTTVINKTDRVQRRAGEVASGTIPVTHNADGTKAISANIQVAVYGLSVNCTASGKWDLEPIEREAYLTAAPDFTDEDNPTIEYVNPFGNDVTKLQACISFTGQYANIAYRDIEKTGTSYTFNFTEQERQKLWTAVISGSSTKVYFTILTEIDGNKYYNSMRKTLTLTGDLNPTMIPWLQDENPVTSLLVGYNNNAVVAGYSNLAYEFEATAKKGATIQTYNVKCGQYVSQNRNGVISGVVPDYDESNITCVAVDNRGYTVESKIPLTTIWYHEPEFYYEPDSLTTSSGGVYFNLRCYWWEGWFDGTEDGSAGGVENKPVVQYRYKVQNEEEYSEWFDSTDFFRVDDEVSYEDYCKVSITGLDYLSSYIVQVRIVDEVVKGDMAWVEEIPVNMVPIYDWSREDFAVNVPLRVKDSIQLRDPESEDEYLEVLNLSDNGHGVAGILELGSGFYEKSVDDPNPRYNTWIGGSSVSIWANDSIDLNGQVTIDAYYLEDFIIEQGTEPMGSNGTWYWTKWRSGKAECYGVRNYGNMAITEAWGSDYSSEDFNQELPDIFAEPPYVMDISMYGSDKFAWIAKKDVPTATKSGIFLVVRPASSTLSQAHISFHAIGSWKQFDEEDY